MLAIVKKTWLMLAAAVLTAGAVHVSVGVQPARAADLDMKKIFRCQAKDNAGIAACDKARGLILSNCTSCHVFVPIVVQQFDKEGWDSLFDRHRSRAPQLSMAQLGEMKAYLTANFNPKIPPPELPEELLKEWTAY
jgi:hypothetical protein